jgi:hypothetical protein
VKSWYGTCPVIRLTRQVEFLLVCPLLARNSQRNLVSRSFDWSGGFDPSNQAGRYHEKDGNEARCAENVRDHPVFTGGIHEDSAEGRGSRDQEVPGCRCSIKEDSETPVTRRRWDTHSVSNIQGKELIEDVGGENPANEIADRHSIVRTSIPPHPSVIDVCPDWVHGKVPSRHDETCH